MADNTKKIEGITFSVAPFMAMEGFKLKATLVRMFGPALGELLGGMKPDMVGKTGILDQVEDMTLNSAPIAAAIEKLMGQLDEGTVEKLLKRLLANVIANWEEGGNKHSIAFMTNFDAAFEAVFSQKLFTVYPVIGFVLEVNYPDFFGKVVQGIGKKIATTFTSETAAGKSKRNSKKSETSES